MEGSGTGGAARDYGREGQAEEEVVRGAGGLGFLQTLELGATEEAFFGVVAGFFEAVGLAFDLDDFGLVGEAVEDRKSVV